MSFRLRIDAEKWFSDIESDLEYRFDAFYFCLMAGFSAVRKAPMTSEDKPAFVDDFPGPYKLNQNLLLGGLINAELRDLLGRSVAMSDKPVVEQTVSRLLSVTGSNTYLSTGVNGGAALMNEYSSGGFNVLSEHLDKPRRLETFLRGFSNLIEKLDAQRMEVETLLESEPLNENVITP